MNDLTFYNRYGKPIAYTDDGEHIYLFSGKPIKSVKSVKPVKSVKQVRPVKPVNSLSWSPLSSELFFNQ